MKNTHELVLVVVITHLYLDQAAASISACALRYNSSLFARPLRLSMIAGSSFSNEDRRLDCKHKFINASYQCLNYFENTKTK